MIAPRRNLFSAVNLSTYWVKAKIAKIKIEGKNFKVSHMGYGVSANFPMEVDNETGKIYVVTPNGKVELKSMPDVIFAKGGYLSFPVALAARVLRIPLIIHESDSVPGRVNLFAGRFARRVAVSFAEAIKRDTSSSMRRAVWSE